eukprot:NODE_6159_length_598_cov_45.451730_g5753_i0.p1 GENE.NODE_6159_length_598_cov_45.451730_g5753_i0~~NODE_6159_length_598_cov_45.451730_g5753_i0.p1  ORF type:complete len:128 (+),score=35.94 NODE_6159_length_598_cov_45.451730_g5753_i0:96-479(+)
MTDGTTKQQKKGGIFRFFGGIIESAFYGVMLFLLAFAIMGKIDDLFPALDKSLEMYMIWIEVALEIGLDIIVVEVLAKLIGLIPLPDCGPVARYGAGIAFAFVVFTRQANLLAKVKHLDTLLDKMDY